MRTIGESIVFPLLRPRPTHNVRISKKIKRRSAAISSLSQSLPSLHHNIRLNVWPFACSSARLHNSTTPCAVRYSTKVEHAACRGF